MGILDLIKIIGEKNIMIQSVSASLLSAKDKKRTKDTELTIVTSQVSANDICTDKGKVGIIIWLERADCDKALGKQ